MVRLSKTKELDEHIKSLQLIDTLGDYTFHYDKEKSELIIYNGKEIRKASLLELSGSVFEEGEDTNAKT